MLKHSCGGGGAGGGGGDGIGGNESGRSLDGDVDAADGRFDHGGGFAVRVDRRTVDGEHDVSHLEHARGGAWMAKGGDIGDLGQAPERRRSLSLASKQRWRSSLGQQTAPSKRMGF